jgi:hypothetical protein
MIPANADLIISVEKVEIESNNKDPIPFQELNKNTQTLRYQTVKHRDGQMVNWLAGVDWGRMLIQPMAPKEEDEEETKTPQALITPKPTPKLLPKPKVESDDEDGEFELYYDQMLNS